MTSINKVNAGENPPKVINVIIEISANSHPINYEYNKEMGLLQVDRFLSTAMHYPCNYGFVPQTFAEDGDPVDVLILTQFSLMTKIIISVRPIGVLSMSDEAGADAKILSVPTSEVDPYYDNINSYSDLSKSLLDKIAHFFSHYKQLEQNEEVKLEGWHGIEKAHKIIETGLLTFSQKFKSS